MSQVAGYVSKTMYTMYTNNTLLQFGETWSRAINLHLNSKQRKKDLEKQLGDQKKPKPYIRQQVQALIWTPARHTKQILRTCHPVSTTAEEDRIITFLSPVLGCYPANYTFEDDSIYLDINMHPERHIKAFIMLNKCLANADYQCIQALPLQSSWVYGHVPMDTQILVHHILKEQYKPVTDKRPAVSTKKPAASDDKSAASTVEQVRFTDEEYWAKVVDLKLRVFKDHSQHTFNRFILTDGVSLCVVRRTVEATLAKKAAGEKRKRNRLAQQAQQTQPVQPPVQQAQPPLQLVAQQAWMSTGPPVRLPMVTPAQQMWMPVVTPVQQT
ncbi:hypothetical protein IWW56_006217 [Coemansia sp. RSA 2131]|nr:hypothetical protein IWW56_006217 [Coemansia sp. RSA 2131]